jgi:hypothetical protein
MRRSAGWLVALVLAALVAPAVRAEDDDLLATVYTESGYELRRDERLFALYAAFNVAGLDRSEEPRTVPFARRAFHPIRASLREALAPLSEKLRGPVDLFLDTHPSSIDAYVAATLLLGDEPEFRPAKALPPELVGLDKMLSDFVRNAKLPKLGRQLGTDYRAEFKKLRDAVDPPFAALRAAFKLSEESAPPLALVPVPLDAAGYPLARRGADDAHVVVFGLPVQGALVLGPVLDAYARLLAEEATAGMTVDGLKEAVDQLRGAGVLSASATPASVLADSLRVAAGAKLGWKESLAEADQGVRKGLLFVREFAKALEEGAAAPASGKNSFAAALAKADLKKLVAEAMRGSDASKGPARSR